MYQSKYTPWGFAQTVEKIADGITHYTTASHGGIELTEAARESMPKELRELDTFAGGNWYEEDCDWTLVALAFPEYFDGADLAHAVRPCYHYGADSERYKAVQAFLKTDAGRRVLDKIPELPELSEA